MAEKDSNVRSHGPRTCTITMLVKDDHTDEGMRLAYVTYDFNNVYIRNHI